jgi:hypothetical protein
MIDTMKIYVFDQELGIDEFDSIAGHPHPNIHIYDPESTSLSCLEHIFPSLELSRS